MKHYQLTLLVVSILFFSCNPDELEVSVPGYITIEKIEVDITNPIQGSASSKIVDSWVFIDDQLVGTFELPVTFPVQKTGNINVKVRGGILNNGLSNDRKIYPFYEFFNLDTTLSAEEELILSPKVEYKSATIFDNPLIIEDFEGTGINWTLNPESGTTFDKNNSMDRFEGLNSGIALLPADETFFEIYSQTFTSFSQLGIAAYLEMDYKCTNDIIISIYANNKAFQNSVVVLRSQSDWNKAYIDFTPVFSTLSTASNYNIAIGFQKPVGVAGELNIDNIKFIRF